MTRVRFVALFFCACTAPPPTPHVALVAPTVSAPVVITREDPVPPNAVRIDAARDSTWARAFPRAKDFVAIEVPDTHTSLLLLWRVGLPHRLKELPPDEDYGANYVAPLDLSLIVAAQPPYNVGAQTISFGSPSGSVNPFALTYCARAGWHEENKPPTPPARHVVSFFSVGVVQGDTEIMIVRDGSTLHVLHRETSDGRCDETKQGPLDICEGFEWERRAEIHLAGNPTLYERAVVDCGAEQMGGMKLVKP